MEVTSIIFLELIHHGIFCKPLGGWIYIYTNIYPYYHYSQICDIPTCKKGIMTEQQEIPSGFMASQPTHPNVPAPPRNKALLIITALITIGFP